MVQIELLVPRTPSRIPSLFAPANHLESRVNGSSPRCANVQMEAKTAPLARSRQLQIPGFCKIQDGSGKELIRENGRP